MMYCTFFFEEDDDVPNITSYIPFELSESMQQVCFLVYEPVPNSEC